MRIVIAAAGKRGRWPADLGSSPHLAPVRGEPLLHRTVRMALAVTPDVHVTGPGADPAYRVPGAVFHPRGPDSGRSEYESTRDLWNTDGRTLLLLGDVCWSEAAFTLVTRTDSGYRVFGRQFGSAVTRTRYGEIWAAAFDAADHPFLDRALTMVERERDVDRRRGTRVHPTGWMLLRAAQGTDLRAHQCLPPWFVDTQRVIPGDPTDDFDFPADYLKHPYVTPVLEPRTDPVTVSMPFHGRPELLRRAVDAVLAQTHPQLTLVVTSDGGPPPWQHLADITDERLVRFELGVNRGRYYADAVVLAACRTPWWTVHDHDDVADPAWLATMLAVTDPPTTAIFTAQVETSTDGVDELVHVLPFVPGRFTHCAHMAGLWSTRWLRTVGGPHPGERLGFDSVMTAIPQMPGLKGWGAVDDPLYHRYRHPGSLTYAPDTGAGSKVRAETRARLRALHARVEAAAARGPAAVGQVIASTVDPALAAQVTRDAARLRTLLDLPH